MWGTACEADLNIYYSYKYKFSKVGASNTTSIHTRFVHSFTIVSAANAGCVSVWEHVSVHVGLSVIWCLLQSASPQASVLPDCTLSTEERFIAVAQLFCLMCSWAYQPWLKKTLYFSQKAHSLPWVSSFPLCFIFFWYWIKWWNMKAVVICFK